jgi:hypothetical protein
MSVNLVTKPVQAASPSARRVKLTGGMALGRESSRAARQWAAAILEVLAGARTPAEAATALSVSVPRYYQVESRALQGLLAACETKARGRGRSPERESRALAQDNERLRRELMRQQALVRIAQRTIGLSAPAPPTAPSGKKTRKRRVARALGMAARLQQHPQELLQASDGSPNPGGCDLGMPQRS